MLNTIISSILEWEFRRFYNAGYHIGEAVFPRFLDIHRRLPRPFVVTPGTVRALAAGEADRYAPQGTIRHDGIVLGIANALHNEYRRAIAREINNMRKKNDENTTFK